MKTIRRLFVNSLIFIVIWILTTSYSAASTPAQLREQLDNKEQITVIDIRLPSQYRAGHIPGAINIPASVIKNKHLANFGKVVLYGSGLGRENVEQIAADLRSNPGTEVDVLVGGYAAWLDAGGVYAAKPGLRKPQVEFITYNELKKHNKGNMVFVDMRKSKSSRNKNAMAVNSLIPATNDNLFAEFPGVQIINNPFAQQTPLSLQSADSRNESPVYVLVDSGDGSARKMAWALKANGNRKVLVLLGGEEMMKRRGRTGLQRMGPGAGLLGNPDKKEAAK